MKKSVILMAGLLAMALAGSAQAATMFAVQSAGGVDQFTVSDAGIVNEAGAPSVFGGPIAGGLSKAPAGAGVALTVPQGNFHFASEGALFSNAAFLVQHTATESDPVGLPGVFSAGTAPNFAFYRINKLANGTIVLPQSGNDLGYINFGSIDTTKNANTDATYRKNVAKFRVKAEKNWTSMTDTATYFAWLNSATGGATTEKMRLSSTGNLGIGTTAPTSKLHVVGLPVFADNTTALAGGLTAGAFYRTATGVLMVVF